MWAGLALLSQDPSLTLADSWSCVLGSLHEEVAPWVGPQAC